MVRGSKISKIGWVNGDVELRRHPRLSVVGAVTSNPVPGEVVDTSESGLGVRTRFQLHVGERNAFYLQTGKVRVRYLGEVRWCHFEGSEKQDSGDVLPVYRSGISLYWADEP